MQIQIHPTIQITNQIWEEHTYYTDQLYVKFNFYIFANKPFPEILMKDEEKILLDKKVGDGALEHHFAM